MGIDRGGARLGGALLAAFTVLAATASHGQSSCLTGASSTEKASASQTDYVFDSNGHAVDAKGVRWLDIPNHALFLDGGANGCWNGGTVDGPYPEDAVYECTSEHGYTGGSCLPYHTTAGMAPNDGPRTIEDVHIKDYGDGISVESASGDIKGRGIWFENLHDDAMETDYAQQSLGCVDCLFERVFMVLAYDRRSSAAGNTPKSGLTMELRNSLIQVHRFTNAYKQKPGHGGVYKDDTFEPRFIVTDNTFLMGPVAGSGQKMFPTASATVECRNNVVLWQGTASAWEDMLGSGDNGANLSALSSCFTVFVKPSSQSAADFRAQRWDPKVAEWKRTHAAAGGSGGTPPPPPPPDPDPDPGPGPETPPQEPILLP